MMSARSTARSVLAAAGAVGSLFLVLPLAVLAWRAGSPAQWTRSLETPLLAQALGISFATTSLSLFLILLFGTPLAYLLARYEFRGKRLLDTAIDLPTVLPPAVAGLALLVTFGRKGLFGPLLSWAGIEIAFTTAAVVMAQCFVAAPFYVRAARGGFEEVDTELEDVAATLGVSSPEIFRRITVPLALPSLLGGAVMAWARALGEFGATLMFAGNFQGRTQTMPLAVYTALESDLDTALTIALILLGVSFAALALLKRLVDNGRK